MNPFCTFMASSVGRILRIAMGAALIVVGLAIAGTVGIVLAIIGLVPLLAGLLDICLLGPLLGCPLSGSKIRAGSK